MERRRLVGRGLSGAGPGGRVHGMTPGNRGTAAGHKDAGGGFGGHRLACGERRAPVGRHRGLLAYVPIYGVAGGCLWAISILPFSDMPNPVDMKLSHYAVRGEGDP